MSVDVGRWKGSSKAGSTRLCSGESSESLRRMGCAGGGGLVSFVAGVVEVDAGAGGAAAEDVASSRALWASCLLLSSTCLSAALGRIFSPTSAR